jgi:enamine deaminase RidA (YjgF/YER057c/UK114 family)
MEIGPDESSDSPSASMRNAGNSIYLSTVGVFESDSNEPSGISSVLRQTQEIYAHAGRALAGRGMSLDHVVKVVEFLTPEALTRYAQVQQVREASLSHRVVTTTIVMAHGMKCKALVQIEFVASADRESIVIGDGHYAGSDRAAALRVGHVVFASGQRAVNQATGKIQYVGDVVSQTRAAYDNLAHALETVGASTQSVVHTTEFVTRAGLADYRNTASVRREVFKRPFPTATGIVCKALLDADALVELEATAYLDPGAR